MGFCDSVLNAYGKGAACFSGALSLFGVSLSSLGSCSLRGGCATSCGVLLGFLQVVVTLPSEAAAEILFIVEFWSISLYQ